MSFIEFKNICKKYAGNNKNSVTDFNLDIEEKEFIAFVGPSGCGKSTTLRMIAGFEEITSGDLFIDGKRVNEVAPADRGISMVFQNYALYPHMTVEKNISYGLKNMKVPADAFTIHHGIYHFLSYADTNCKQGHNRDHTDHNSKYG